VPSFLRLLAKGAPSLAARGGKGQPLRTVLLFEISLAAGESVLAGAVSGLGGGEGFNAGAIYKLLRTRIQGGRPSFLRRDNHPPESRGARPLKSRR